MIFVKEPGTYKIVWDNSYSWFTGKTVRYRISVMKPLSEIDITRRVDFELLKRNMAREQNKKIEENKAKQVEMSVIEKPEEKKILLAKYERRERVYNPVYMKSKEDLVQLYPKDDTIQLKYAYISIPLLLTSTKLRFLDPENTFELDAEKFPEKDGKALIFKRVNEFSELDLEEGFLIRFFDECLPVVLKKVRYCVTFELSCHHLAS